MPLRDVDKRPRAFSKAQLHDNPRAGDSGRAGSPAQCAGGREKKEGTPARCALRYDHCFGESDGDYTLFGATVDRFNAESVSRMALLTPCWPRFPCCVSHVLQHGRYRTTLASCSVGFTR